MGVLMDWWHDVERAGGLEKYVAHVSEYCWDQRCPGDPTNVRLVILAPSSWKVLPVFTPPPPAPAAETLPAPGHPAPEEM